MSLQFWLSGVHAKQKPAKAQPVMSPAVEANLPNHSADALQLPATAISLPHTQQAAQANISTTASLLYTRQLYSLHHLK